MPQICLCRIKGLQISPNPLENTDEDSKLLTVASSDGYIKIYSITHDQVNMDMCIIHDTSYYQCIGIAVVQIEGTDGKSCDQIIIGDSFFNY